VRDRVGVVEDLAQVGVAHLAPVVMVIQALGELVALPMRIVRAITQCRFQVGKFLAVGVVAEVLLHAG
jgi:hypothetical protein